jgi:hypothetical protein
MNPREQRVIQIGAYLVVAALVGLRLAPAAVRWARALDQQVSSGRQLVRSEQDALGRAAALEDSGRAVRGRLQTLAPRILPGRLESQAISDLSERLGVLASHAGVRLERTDAVTDSARVHGLRRVSVHAAVEGDTGGLVSLLRAINAGDLALSLREVRIVAQDPASPDGRPEVLNGDLTIAGWFLAPDGP